MFSLSTHLVQVGGFRLRLDGEGHVLHEMLAPSLLLPPLCSLLRFPHLHKQVGGEEEENQFKKKPRLQTEVESWCSLEGLSVQGQ